MSPRHPSRPVFVLPDGTMLLHLRHLSDLRFKAGEPQISQMVADDGTEVRKEHGITVIHAGARFLGISDEAEKFRTAETSPDPGRWVRTVLAGDAETTWGGDSAVVGAMARIMPDLSGEPRFPHLCHLSDLRFKAGEPQISQMVADHCSADNKPPAAPFPIKRADP